MSQELKSYIYEALKQGLEREKLIHTLSQAGWSESVVKKTLDQFAGVDSVGLPIPAPRMQAHQIARDCFMYSLNLITLSMCAFALGSLCFELITHYIPDPGSRESYSSGSRNINWAIAQLVITLPVYFWISKRIQTHITQFPEKRESLIRKFIIYAILGITAIISLGDLIVTLTTFLEGEITLRFLAKAAVVLSIPLLIFVYYLSEMRQDDVTIKTKQ